jgi:hypothetical protein
MENRENKKRSKNAACARKKWQDKGRVSRFTLEFAGDNQRRLDITTKLTEVKTNAISHILDFYIQQHINPTFAPMDETPAPTPSYVQVEQADVDQDIFLTAIDSLAQN